MRLGRPLAAQCLGARASSPRTPRAGCPHSQVAPQGEGGSRGVELENVANVIVLPIVNANANWKLATLGTGNISTMAHFRRMREALHGPAGGLETDTPLPGPRWRPAPAGGAPGARALPAGKMASRVKKERDEAYGFDACFVRPWFVEPVCHDDFPEKVTCPCQILSSGAKGG